MSHQLVVPALGESISEATVARWLKKVGDMVKIDDPLVELETDKVTLEVNAPHAGILEQIAAGQGTIVQVGQVLGRIQDHQGQAAWPAQPPLPMSDQAFPQTFNPSAVSHEIPASMLSEMSSHKPTATPGTHMVGSPAGQSFAPPPHVLPPATPGHMPLGSYESYQINPSSSSTLAPGHYHQSPLPSQGVSMLQDVPGAVSYDAFSDDALHPAQPHAQASILSPAARKIAAEHNISGQDIQGTGRDGRITKQDVVKHLEPVAPVAPILTSVVSQPNDRPSQPQPQHSQSPSSAVPSASSMPPAPAVSQMTAMPLRPFQMTQVAQPEERVRMTRLRQRIAERLKEAQNTAAMLTTFNEIDMSHVMATRESYREKFEKRFGIKLGFMSFFVKAAVLALKEIPSINAEIDGDYILYKNHYDIGVAVSSPQGLVVPVVRDADHLNFAEIENSIGQLSEKARTGKLSMSDLSGGTFTITNGGVFGSLMSTPILNPPQSGILGMHKIQKRPIVVEDRVEIRPMMYVALTYDHRIIDGREAVTFLVRVKENIEDPQRILLGI